MKVSACSVADCAQVAVDVVERGWAAADRLFFVGGSHSGFIGAHLAGQYPTLFQAFSLRNAVTNIAAMAAATDIGDWCLEEVGLPGAHDMAAQLGPDAEAAKKAMVNTTACERFRLAALRCSGIASFVPGGNVRRVAARARALRGAAGAAVHRRL